MRAVAVELDRLVRASRCGRGRRPPSRARRRSARGPRRSAISAAKIPPRIAPWSRMWRTRVRVSTPVIAGTPQSASQSSQPPSASAASSPFLRLAHDHRARLDAVGLHRRRADAVVADQRVGEGDDLAGVAGVGDRLLIAGHRGVEDDLAGGLGRRPPQSSPSKRVPSSSSTYPLALGVHLTERLHLLERVGARSRRAARRAPSRRWSARAPARSIFASPSSRLASVREPTASAATWTSTSSSSRSSTVWLTQTWVSIPQTSAWSRPPRSKPSASAAEKRIFSSGCDSVRQVLGDLGDGVPEPLRVLLGDDDRDPDRRCALDQRRGRPRRPRRSPAAPCETPPGRRSRPARPAPGRASRHATPIAKRRCR